MENLEATMEMNKTPNAINKPENYPKCGSIFIDYQNGRLRCLVKKCSYTFSNYMIRKNGKLIAYYS